MNETENTTQTTEENKPTETKPAVEKSTEEKPAAQEKPAQVENKDAPAEKTYTEKEVQKRIKDALAAEKKSADDKADEALREITALKNQTACYKAGVREECIEDAITLAAKLTDDKTDFGKALAKVLEKYPQFKNAEKPVTTGVKTKDSSEGGDDAALRKYFGLK